MLASSIVTSHLMFNPAQPAKKFQGKHWQTIALGLCVQQMEKAYYFCVCVCVCVCVSQSCPTLCDPMECSPPGSSVHGILQARKLEWEPFLSPGALPDPGIEPGSPVLQADSLPSEPPGKPLLFLVLVKI